MSQVPTVRGPVSSAGLGPTYMHEHIFTLTADVQQNCPQEWGSEEARIADAAGKLRALRVLCESAGVDPGRVLLAHSGDTTDCDHLAGLADAGFTLGMDRFGLNVETTFEARADTLVEMCRRGYAGSMVLSQDASCYIDWIDPEVLPFMAQWHYLHIGDEVLPYVRDRGVTEDDIGVMLIENPRHFFETAASGAG